MEKQNKKRHLSLQPLSRHHHHALVMAQLLIKQEKESSYIQDKLKEFWKNGGQSHFREEEEFLFPEYAKYVTKLDPEVAQALEEHIFIRSLVDEIITSSTFDRAKMMKLGNLIKDHVFHEERVIFPMIEQVLSEESLAKIAPYFSEHLSSSCSFNGRG